MPSEQARKERLRRVVERLHAIFWLAHRALALLTQLRRIEAQPAPFISLRSAMRDSWAQTVVMETCKLFECDKRSASIPTAQILIEMDGSLYVPYLETRDGDDDALRSMRFARNRIMAHGDILADSATMAAAPRLLELASPFMLATKEHVLGQPAMVLHEGVRVAYYEVERAPRDLERLFALAAR
jgi:hypothetical protein